MTSRPDVEINKVNGDNKFYESHHIGIGWREHPHFKTGREIKETFKRNLMAENDASYIAMKPETYKNEQIRVN